MGLLFPFCLGIGCQSSQSVERLWSSGLTAVWEGLAVATGYSLRSLLCTGHPLDEGGNLVLRTPFKPTTDKVPRLRASILEKRLAGF